MNHVKEPCIGQLFSSLKDVDEYFDNYGESVHHLFVKCTTDRISSEKLNIYNSNLEFYHMEYCCKFGGKKYQSKKNKNKRPNTR